MAYGLCLLRKLADGIRAYKAFKTNPNEYVKESSKLNDTNKA